MIVLVVIRIVVVAAQPCDYYDCEVPASMFYAARHFYLVFLLLLLSCLEYLGGVYVYILISCTHITYAAAKRASPNERRGP